MANTRSEIYVSLQRPELAYVAAASLGCKTSSKYSTKFYKFRWVFE